jgi:hypothetical protein
MKAKSVLDAGMGGRAEYCAGLDQFGQHLRQGQAVLLGEVVE